MKYYSQTLNKLFDSQEQLNKQENSAKEAEEKRIAAEKKKTEERATRAKQVEIALEEAKKATQTYRELLNKFVKDYGSFHYSISDKNEPFETLFDFLNWF